MSRGLPASRQGTLAPHPLPAAWCWGTPAPSCVDLRPYRGAGSGRLGAEVGVWLRHFLFSPQAALMVSLIWKYYSVPVAVVPAKWITPLDRLVAFPTRVAGACFPGDTSRV